ncbi:MAG: VanZ family protein [Chitinophagales bacterium]
MKDTSIIKKYLPAVLWSAFIFFLCFLPGNKLPEEEWLDKIHFDKIVHLFLYLILFLLIIHARKNGHTTPFYRTMAVFICLAQGILIECIQGSSLIEGRSFDVWDIAANAIGVSAGIIASRLKHKTN